MAVAGFHEFASREKLAQALAEAIAAPIEAASNSGTPAGVAFSGGSTPDLLLKEFARHDERFDWDYTTITLVDERRVPAEHERSNQRLIEQTLFSRIENNASIEEHFVPLFHGSETAHADCEITAARLEELLQGEPLTAVVLGMGTDGHTASWFPGGNNLAAATNQECDASFISMTAPGAGEERITMTLPAVANAHHVFLHIEGAEKRRVFEQALENGPAAELPIRFAIQHPTLALNVYWTA